MKILITTDGQKHSEEAIEFAAKLFAPSNPGITIMHVYNANKEPKRANFGEKYFSEAAQILEKYGLSAEKKLVEGRISGEIIKECATGKYHTVVLGFRESSSVLESLSNSLLTETEDELLTKLHISLLIVRNPTSGDISDVLACTDGSPFAEAAIDFWGRMKKDPEPRVTLLNILSQVLPRGDYLLSKQERKKLLDLYVQNPESPVSAVVNRGKDILSQYGIHDIRLKLREGDVAEAIIKESQKGNYDLVVLGFKGGSKGDLKMGNQAKRVLEEVNVPVFIFCPQKMK